MIVVKLLANVPSPRHWRCVVLVLLCYCSHAKGFYPSDYSSGSPAASRIGRTTDVNNGLDTLHNTDNNDTPSWDDTSFLPDSNKPAFEDHVAAWRYQQQQQQQEEDTTAASSLVDERGRPKLITPNLISKASLSCWFFALMFRALSHYEMADALKTTVLRRVTLLPASFLFIGNMLGFVLSIMTSQNDKNTKMRFKALLNMNKLCELVLFVYYFMQLTVVSIITKQRFIPKEIYVGRILHCVMFLLTSQAFTKVTWGAAPPITTTTPPIIQQQNYYTADDDTMYSNDENRHHQQSYYDNSNTKY